MKKTIKELKEAYEEHKKYMKGYMRKWRSNNPQKAKEIIDRYNKKVCIELKKLREQARTLLGGKCANPYQFHKEDITDIRVLQIDHKNSDGALERKNKIVGWKLYKKILKNPEKYQLLCANCNCLKREKLGEKKGGFAYLHSGK